MRNYYTQNEVIRILGLLGMNITRQGLIYLRKKDRIPDPELLGEGVKMYHIESIPQIVGVVSQNRGVEIDVEEYATALQFVANEQESKGEQS